MKLESPDQARSDPYWMALVKPIMGSEDMNAVVAEQRSVVSTPADVLRVAIEHETNMERLKALMDLQERWDANEARKDFVAAMADFKSEPMRILKTKHVSIPGGAKFSHATLADVVDGVVAALAKYGLEHRWDPKQLDNGWIEVTCIVRHKRGHEERTTLRAPPDDSGKKNTIQQIASTVTYLERYTLMAACGLAAKDMDDDGRAAGQQKQEIKDPEGFDEWKADMTALADEGTQRLQDAWSTSKPEYRRHVVKHAEDWWAETKRKAAKVTP